MKKYYSYLVKKIINIKKLKTIEYVNISKNFYFENESHNFHEFAYVDSGAVYCNVSGARHLIAQEDMFLIQPNVPHSYEYAGADSTQLFIVCFDCSCDFLELIRGKNTLEMHEKQLMSEIFSEAQKAFKFPFDKKLTLLNTPDFGAQQLVESSIEALFIRLIRTKLSNRPDIKFIMNSTDFSSSIVNDIISILKANLYGKISLDEIQSKLYYSKTYLNNSFKSLTGESIMRYYRNLKIDEAKRLIKEGEPVAEISDKLFFESPNYFTKVFKATTGLTPSKYKKTI